MKLTTQEVPTETPVRIYTELDIAGNEVDVLAELPNEGPVLLASFLVDADGKIAFRTYATDEPAYISTAKNGKLGYEGGNRK